MTLDLWVAKPPYLEPMARSTPMSTAKSTASHWVRLAFPIGMRTWPTMSRGFPCWRASRSRST